MAIIGGLVPWLLRLALGPTLRHHRVPPVAVKECSIAPSRKAPARPRPPRAMLLDIQRGGCRQVTGTRRRRSELPQRPD